jgi:hypothetical protein
MTKVARALVGKLGAHFNSDIPHDRFHPPQVANKKDRQTQV